VVAVADVTETVPLGNRVDDVPLALEPGESIGKQGEDVDLH
jgi:hypothetical protein